MVVKSLKLFLELFFKELYCFRVSYWFFASIPFFHTMLFDRWYLLFIACRVFTGYASTYHATTCMLLPDNCLANTWLLIITLWECNTRYPDMLLYSSTYVLLILLTCSCILSYTDNYIINYRRITYIGSGKTDEYQYVFVFIVVLGMLYNSNFQFYLRASRCSEGCAGTLLPVTFLNGHINKTHLLYALRPVPYTSDRIP